MITLSELILCFKETTFQEVTYAEDCIWTFFGTLHQCWYFLIENVLEEVVAMTGKYHFEHACEAFLEEKLTQSPFQ